MGDARYRKCHTAHTDGGWKMVCRFVRIPDTFSSVFHLFSLRCFWYCDKVSIYLHNVEIAKGECFLRSFFSLSVSHSCSIQSTRRHTHTHTCMQTITQSVIWKPFTNISQKVHPKLRATEWKNHITNCICK